MPKQELLGEVKKLINLGKEKGFLTYDDLNSTLPADVVSSDQFSTIMTMFGEMDIEKPSRKARKPRRRKRMKRKSISRQERSAGPTIPSGST